MISKKVIVGIIFLVFIVGGYFMIIYGTNIPQTIKRQQEVENQPQEMVRCVVDGNLSMCPAGSQPTVEECLEIYKNPSMYYPEAVEKCKQVGKYAQPSVSANTQEKKDEVIQRLEKTYLFTDHDLDDLYFNITEDMLTPEGLEFCADLWEDMVQKTLHIRTGDPKTIGKAMNIQDEFQRSSCAGTQNEWKK